MYIGWSYCDQVTQSNLLLKPGHSEFYLAGFWKPAGMGTAQPPWATCHTAWLPSWADSFSLYPVWSSPFSCYLLSLTNTTVLDGLGLGKTLEHVLKTCWFQPPGPCPGRRQGPGHACVLSVSYCFLQTAPTVLCTVDQQLSHWAVLRGTNLATGVWYFKGKGPRSQTLQHLHFLVPCPLSNPFFFGTVTSGFNSGEV